MATVPETSMPESIYVDLHKPAVIVGGCFVLVALVLSLFLILQHLRHYTNPAEQKWVVAVLFMVPVYATESILSLWNSKLSLACDILRNCYEAFALYAFGRYMISCLGGESRVVEFLEDESRKQQQKTKPLLDGTNENRGDEDHKSLWNFFRHPGLIGKNLLIIEKFGLVQYMILKTACALLALILELFGVYGDGEFRVNYGYPYIAVVINFSQMWALYCLVQFYNVTHERLKPIKPLAKFISFKAIVFATWWQGVGIALLCTLRVLPKKGKLQTGLQDFLICIEMAIAAIAHVFVFSVEPYRYAPANEYHKIVSETETEAVMLEEGGDDSPTLVEKTETKVEVPGTRVTESVQDIIVEGGQRVVKDVVLTISQAIEPVEKGVTKIHERFHHRYTDSAEGKHEEVDEIEYIREDEDGSEGETAVSFESETVDKSWTRNFLGSVGWI